MSRNNDPVDNAIEEIGGAIGAALIVGTIAYFAGRQQRNSQKDFELPNGLVMDYDDPNFVAPDARPWWIKQFGLYVFYAVLATLFFGSIAFHYLFVRPGSHVIWAIPGLLVCLFVLYQLIRSKTRYDAIPTTCSADRSGLDRNAVQVYSILLPKETEWNAQTAGRFMQQALFKVGSLIFQIVAEHDRIAWRILDRQGNADPSVVRQAIAAFYPEAEVVHSDYSEHEFDDTFFRLTRAVYQDQHFLNPIAYVTDLVKADPLVNLVQEMSGLARGERIVYTLAVTEAARFVYQQAQDVLTVKVPINPFDVGSLAYAAGAKLDNRVSRFEDQDLRIYLSKLENLVYQAVLFVQVDAAQESRAWDLMSLISHVTQYDRQHSNRLNLYEDTTDALAGWINNAKLSELTSPIGLLDRWLCSQGSAWRSCRLLLDTQELAALWHLPYVEMRAANIAWIKGRQLPIPNVMRRESKGVLLGVNRHAGQIVEVYLPDEDRATHMSVIGQTGSGKSTLLHNIIHADIRAGRGIAVIDPKGHLVRDILRASVPAERENDLVLLDVADTQYPPPLNLLAVPGAMENINAVDLLLAVFEKLYPDFSGTRMADTFSMAVQTLWKASLPTLLDVERLFEDLDYRRTLVARTDNFVIQRFWAQFESKTQAQQDELAQPIVHRMRAFYGNQILLPMMCHPEPLDLFNLIRQNKIILVSVKISEAKLPPREQHLLGEVLISQIQMAAMSDAIVQRPFYLYIDEAQNFVTTSLPQMLTTARSSGLALVMANQHLKQLSGDTLDALLGNIGAAVSFQVGEHDARIVARLRSCFTADDLMNLDKYKAGVFMRYKGETQPAFSLNTLPPPKAPSEAAGKKREQELRELSRSKYNKRTANEIMDWLRERYAPSEKSAPNGRVEDSFYDQP